MKRQRLQLELIQFYLSVLEDFKSFLTKNLLRCNNFKEFLKNFIDVENLVRYKVALHL